MCSSTQHRCVLNAGLAADEFDPDRFLDDRVKKYLLPNPFIFLPFNAGPRICLGQQVSPFTMYLLLLLLKRVAIVCIQRDVVLLDQVAPNCG